MCMLGGCIICNTGIYGICAKALISPNNISSILTGSSSASYSYKDVTVCIIVIYVPLEGRHGREMGEISNNGVRVSVQLLCDNAVLHDGMCICNIGFRAN